MKKSVLILIHLSFWILIALVSYVFLNLLLMPAAILGGGNQLKLIDNLYFIAVSWVVSGFVFYLFYFSAPFFLKKLWRLYLLILAIIICAITHALLAKFRWNNSDFLLEIFITYTPISMLILLAFLFRSLTEWVKDRKLNAELEKEKIAVQLELLKSKLNPHFLFNSLNNIDVLIEESPKTASEYIKKLSDILRYVLYETKDAETELSKEIEQIKSYIDLQKIRTDNAEFVSFKIIGELEDQRVAPMLFIPFVENAFKHCKNKSIKNAIDIEIQLNNESVKMLCKNYYDTNQLEIVKNEGLGIETIKQRLNLLYPKKHELIIDKTENWFNVSLAINLKNDN